MLERQPLRILTPLCRDVLSLNICQVFATTIRQNPLLRFLPCDTRGL
jgi:hypothetical protein